MNTSACALSALLWMAGPALAQQPSSPVNEPAKNSAVRSPNSMGADLTVPLCPTKFHDGIDSEHERNIAPAKIKSTVPASITQQAIDAAGKTHIGNFNVIVNVVVDAKGNPEDLCIEKSSSYGLDGSAAAAVMQYRFQPAKRDGQTMKMRLPVDVRFVSPNPPTSLQPIPDK